MQAIQGLSTLPYPRNKDCLVIGVASHNLFHIAFAQQLAELREVTSMVEIEMLEGMANAEAMAVKQKFGSVLLLLPNYLKKRFSCSSSLFGEKVR